MGDFSQKLAMAIKWHLLVNCLLSASCLESMQAGEFRVACAGFE